MNKNSVIIDYLASRRCDDRDLHGNSHHACLLVPNHLKGLSAKGGYLW